MATEIVQPLWVHPNGSIHVRVDTIDEETGQRTTHRHVVEPGAPTTNEPEEVKELAKEIHTKKAVEDFKDARAVLLGLPKPRRGLLRKRG